MHLNIQKAKETDLLLTLKQGTKAGLMTLHYFRKAQKTGGVIKYMWYSQQVERQ